MTTTILWRGYPITFNAHLDDFTCDAISQRLCSLAECVTEDSIPIWLNTPSEMFDGRTPAEHIAKEGPQVLDVMIAALNGSILD